MIFGPLYWPAESKGEDEVPKAAFIAGEAGQVTAHVAELSFAKRCRVCGLIEGTPGFKSRSLCAY